MKDKSSSLPPDLLGMKTVIRTKDYRAALHFYTNLLKLEVISAYDDGDGSRGSILQVGREGGSAFIELSEIRKDHRYHQEAFDRSFENDKVDLQIRTGNVAYWAKRLREHKWPAKGPVLRPWGAHYLYLKDPDGLQIILYEDGIKK